MSEDDGDVSDVDITPISHATMVMEWDGAILYTDPIGGTGAMADQPKPNIVLVTDIHGDHLDVPTLEASTNDSTTIIAPQAVYDQLSPTLQARTIVVANGQTIEEQGFTIEAIPMYNLPEAADSRHVKGRGNGYVVEHDGVRVYIAGDTGPIDEMRNLQDIDMAFVPMNPTYTMTPGEAAEVVLAFAPRTVYPYHYREPDGFGDVEEFERLVNEGNPDINVELLEWYPE